MKENFMEEWRDIKGYEGLYKVSNTGKIMSLNYAKSRQSKIRQNMITESGYARILLSNNNKNKCYFVHRLVAEAFLSNPNNYPSINHKDENKQNNNVDNLEWCTFSYNNNYGTKNQRISDTKSKVVYQYSKDGILLNWYKSAKIAEEYTGIKHNNICKCCLGRVGFKTAGGYIWKREKEI